MIHPQVYSSQQVRGDRPSTPDLVSGMRGSQNFDQDAFSTASMQYAGSMSSRQHHRPIAAQSSYNNTKRTAYNPTQHKSQPKTRSLTLRQLHDIIFDIYSSKLSHDQKCLQTAQPLETLEEFMYTFLNQRYGLRRLTIQHASSIVKAVKQFGEDDFDTLLFGKLLKGSVPEGYRGMVEAVKRGIADCIKSVLGMTQSTKVYASEVVLDGGSLRKVAAWLANFNVIDDVGFDTESFWALLLERQRQQITRDFHELQERRSK